MESWACCLSIGQPGNNGSLTLRMDRDYLVRSAASGDFLRTSAGYHEEMVLEELDTLLIFTAEDLRFSSLD